MREGTKGHEDSLITPKHYGRRAVAKKYDNFANF